MAERAGAKEAEVFGTAGRSVDVDLRKNQIELASESFHQGLGLRAVVRGAVGFSSTSDMTKLEAVAEAAVRSARARGSDESWRSLPLPEAVQTPRNIFDVTIDRIAPEDCLDLARQMLSGCQEVKSVEPASGGVACVSGMEFVVNSWGIELSEKGTSMHASMEAIAKGNDVATGTEFHNSRLLDTDLYGVGKAAAEMAISSINGSKAQGGIYDVILKPVAFVELLEYAFVPSIFADNVQKGRSHLAVHLGEKIGSDHLGIIDDGLLSGGMGTTAFDGEGVASKSNVVIEKGVLKRFLYDSYTAGKDGLKSTGNAVRSGYSDVPRLGLRNLIVGSEHAFDLLEETKGMLVNGFIGAHTANPISGDFSVEARNSFFVSPGEALRPITSMMLAGNIFDLLKDLDVGTDVRAVDAVVTPSVRARMKVVGS
ncbi:Zinc metalloprotease TldD [uncultured archaeon]|nr:Zinc metalloprotease TldD [uncultured archaeon]